MANLTLTIADDVLRAARIRALEQGTSVNAVVRGYLEQYAGRAQARQAVTAFLALANEASGSSGAARTWSRDALYER